MRWRVQLHKQAAVWVTELAHTDRIASSWVAVAIDLLRHGPPRRRHVVVSSEQAPSRFKRRRLSPWGSFKSHNEVHVWYALHPRQSTIHVVRGSLTRASTNDSWMIYYKSVPWRRSHNEGRGAADPHSLPWRAALRVTGWVARVLPVADQQVYREVFASELFDLAQTAHPRRAQLTYAIQVVVRVLALRHALRMPASEPRRRAEPEPCRQVK